MSAEQRARQDPSTDVFIGALRQLGEHDLTFTQLAAMVYLMRFPSSSVGTVAGALGRSLAAAGRLADDLVRARLVAREESPSDRRVKQLRLTPKGRRFVARLHERRLSHAQLAGGLAKSLSDRERAVVDEALMILARHGAL